MGLEESLWLIIDAAMGTLPYGTPAISRYTRITAQTNVWQEQVSWSVRATAKCLIPYTSGPRGTGVSHVEPLTLLRVPARRQRHADDRVAIPLKLKKSDLKYSEDYY